MPDQPTDYEPVTEVSTEPWLPLSPEEWTEPEKWVWEQVRTGRAANFNERYDKELDPKKEEVWNEEEKKNRGLRPDFLRTILLCDPWRGLITHVGVRILGAHFEEKIDLSNAEVGCELWLDQSRFEGGLDSGAAHFGFLFSLDGSVLHKLLAMDRAEIKASLFMRNGRFSSARLPGVQVGGQLSMTEAEFSDELAMYGAEIKGDLFMRQGRFASARLPGVQVGGQLAMEGAEFSEELAMDRAEIKGGLFMRNGRFASARLHGVQVGGQLSMTEAEFSDELAMDRAEIKDSLFMRKGRFASARLHGVQVGGQLDMNEAKFSEELIMDGAGIKGGLFMGKGRFASVRLPGAQVGGQLSMTEAKLSGGLVMDRADIQGDLFMLQGRFSSARLPGVQLGGQLAMGGAEFSEEVNFQGAAINGELIMTGAACKKELAMDRAEIKGGLFMRNGRFASARLPGVQVGGQLDTEGAEFSEELAMDGAEIKDSLFMDKGRFASARLHGAQVGGQLSMTGAGFKGGLNCEGIQVGSHLLTAGARFFEKVNLSFCMVGGGLSLGGTHLGEVDLSQSDIEGALRLSIPGQGKTISWYKGSLDLRHTTTGDVQDGLEDWPAFLLLDGFRYACLGSERSVKVPRELLEAPETHLEKILPDLKKMKNPEEKTKAIETIKKFLIRQKEFTTTSDRPASWYVGWLEKQIDFSMDPYQQCAKFLRETGQPDKANEVMYAGLERERRHMDKWSKPWLGRTLLKWTIGHGLGYRYFRSLFWAALFLFIGAVVCGAAGGSSHGALFCFGFSLDEMLPLIDLRPEHIEMSIKLSGFPKFYFIFIQQFVGWLLVLCVAAGLAGVGKPGGRD